MKNILTDPIFLLLVALAVVSFCAPAEYRVLLPIAIMGGAIGYLYNRVHKLTDRVEKLERWQSYHMKQSEIYQRYLSEKLTSLSRDEATEVQER